MPTADELKALITADNAPFKRALADSEGALKGFESVGKAAFVAVSVAAVAIGAALTKGLFDAFKADVLTDKLQAALGLTEEAAAISGKVAGDVYRDAFGGSLAEVNEAIKAVGQGLADLNTTSAPALEALTKNVLAISEAFEIDVGGATDAAEQLVKKFGVSAEDALDLLVVGFQKSGKSAEEVSAVITELSGPFAQLGFSAKGFVSTLISSGEAGVSSLQDVGTGVRNLLRTVQTNSDQIALALGEGFDTERLIQKLLAGGEEAGEAFGDLIGTLQAMDDDVKRNELSALLFGKSWQTIGPEITSVLHAAQDSVGEFQGATDRMAASLKDNAATQLESFKRSLLGFAQDVAGGPLLDTLKSIGQAFQEGFAGGAGVDPAELMDSIRVAFERITPVLETAARALGKVIGFLSEHPALITAAVSAIVAIAAAKTIWSTVTGILAIKTLALNAVMVPVLLVILAVTAAILAVVVAMKWWDESVEETGSGFGNFQRGIAVIWDSIKETFTTSINAIREFVTTGFASIGAGITAAWSGVKDFFTGLWDGIKAVWSAGLDFFRGLWDDIVGIVTGFFAKGVALGADVIQGLWDGIKERWELFENWWEAAWNRIIGWVKRLLRIGSPSRLFESYGQNVVQGLTEGLRGLDNVLDVTVARTTRIDMGGLGRNGGGSTSNRFGDFNVTIHASDARDMEQQLDRWWLNLKRAGGGLRLG